MGTMIRSDETEVEYVKKLRTIKKNYAQGLLNDGEFDSKESAIECFNRIKALLKTSSVKKYRVVLRWHLASIGIDIDSETFRITEKSTKSNKLKSYPKSAKDYILDKIEIELANKRLALLPHVEFLRLHIVCGRMLGYRLSELLQTSVSRGDDKDRFELKIKNGKNSNDRANGEFRVLYPPRVHEGYDVEGSVKRLLELVNEKVINEARRLHDELRKGMPKDLIKHGDSLCMTSTRHEYVLAAREAKDRIALSASLGHISTETQKRSYGRKGIGVRQVDNSLVEYVGKTQVDIKNMRMTEERFKKKDKLRQQSQRQSSPRN